MKWILIIWIHGFTAGDFKSIEFTNAKSCQEAKVLIQHNTNNYKSSRKQGVIFC